jgi:APA family basic amino acid/polyamine antiporter
MTAAAAADGPGDEPLRRDIGLVGSAFLAFNGLVGAGIFVLPGLLADRFGAFSPWAFPLFGLLALAIAWPFARIAGHHGRSGGPVVYAAAFGPAAAFQAGWIYYVARVTALAANLNVLVTYLASFAPPIGQGWPRAAVILAVTGAIGAVNVAGVRRAVRLLDFLTLMKALPLVILAVAALAWSGLPAPPAALPPAGELEAAALLILYAFVGFENGVVTAGETRDPKRTIPRALIATVIATAALYVLVQLAYVAAMPAGAGGAAPLVAFGRAVAGDWGGWALTAAAVFSVLGNVSGGVTGSARTTYAMARDGLLPAWFGAIDRRFATPARSIWFMAALIALLALSGSFVWLAVASVLARMFVYGIGIAALFRAEPGRPGVAAAALLGLLVCGWVAAQAGAAAWATLAALALAGFALYGIAKRSGG